MNLGEQEWRSGDSVRLPPMWPVEFVVGSHPCSERFFAGCSSFPHSLLNSNAIWKMSPISALR